MPFIHYNHRLKISKIINAMNNIRLNMVLDPEKLEYYEKKYERNSVEDAINYLSNKWTIHILRDLFLGKNHFNEFKSNRKSLDSRALSRCLKSMEANDLIYKVTDENNSKNTQYFLTQKGKSLNRVFYELFVFAIENDDNDEHSHDEKNEIKEIYKEILNIP